MKKLVFVLVSMIILAVICIYVFIPGTINVSKIAISPSTENGTERMLADQSSWIKWWPSKTSDGNNRYYLNDYSFSTNRRVGDDIEIIITNKQDSVASVVNVVPKGTDSAIFTWKCKLETNLNPFNRLMLYFKASDIKKSMDEITPSLLTFCSNQENVYGFKITMDVMTDTLLITYKAGVNEYPDTKYIYGYIDQLKTYAASQGAIQTGTPLIHLEQMDSSLYGRMVAIPIDREIKSHDDFIFKHMPHDNLLVSPEIKGGVNEVAKAYRSMVNYMTDYQRISPGISFMSFITDRANEPDSFKWRTKILYPVF